MKYVDYIVSKIKQAGYLVRKYPREAVILGLTFSLIVAVA